MLALLLVLLFIPLKLRTARPLLDVRLFQRRTFLVGNLIGWVRRGQSVRLHLSPVAIPAGAPRLVVVPGGSAAGPTGTGRHGRNHRGGTAVPPRGGVSPCPGR